MRRLAFLLCIVLLPVAATAQDDAREWLARAAIAARDRDYAGVIAFVRDGQFDSVRVERDGTRQRIVALTGDARELLVDTGAVHGRFPGGVEMRASTDWLAPFTLDRVAAAGLAAHYTLVVGGRDRIAGLDATVIDATPRDAARYAYRLWLENESALLLGSLLVAPDGAAVERQVFTSIRIAPPRPRAAADTAVDAPPRPAPATRDAPALGGLPDGFVLVATAPVAADGERQFVFADGLASVSIYLGRGRAALRGASARGALSAYGRDVADGHVVVVGELPAATVRRIADAVEADQLPR